MKDLSVDNLLGIKQLTENDINIIFETADSFKRIINRPIRKVPTLRDITIANLFFENSTRTKLSFELAEKRLSADIINFSSSVSSVNKGESLLDTINNILVMKVDMIVMRHPSPGAPHFISDKINTSIINAGDGTHEHPTQALLDAFSIKEKLGTLKGKKIAIIGDILHSRVAISNIYSLKKLGAEVMICGPSTLIPKYMNDFEVIIENDINKALIWCDVANVLRIQLERQKINFFPSLRDLLRRLFSRANSCASFSLDLDTPLAKIITSSPKSSSTNAFAKSPLPTIFKIGPQNFNDFRFVKF
jgi:aspartate carbamoyltransferase catalytic subunit